jgi:hypothetical protein
VSSFGALDLAAAPAPASQLLSQQSHVRQSGYSAPMTLTVSITRLLLTEHSVSVQYANYVARLLAQRVISACYPGASNSRLQCVHSLGRLNCQHSYAHHAQAFRASWSGARLLLDIHPNLIISRRQNPPFRRFYSPADPAAGLSKLTTTTTTAATPQNPGRLHLHSASLWPGIRVWFRSSLRPTQTRASCYLTPRFGMGF